MNLAHGEMGINIEFHENRVNVLVIENPSLFSAVVGELFQQIEHGEGEFVLAEADKIYKFQNKVSLVLNPISVSCNEKKLLSALIKELERVAVEDVYEDTVRINQEILWYIEKLSAMVPYPTIFSDTIELSSLLKAGHLEFDDVSGDLFERINHYIKILSSLAGVKLLVFVNLKAYFSEEAIKGIYQTAAYCKCNLLLIENIVRDKMEEEDILVIDKDICFIQF